MARGVRRPRAARGGAGGPPVPLGHAGRGDPPHRRTVGQRQPRGLPGRAGPRGRAAPERRPPAPVPGGHRRRRAEPDRLRSPQRRGGPDRGGRPARRPPARRGPAARGGAAARGREQRDDPLGHRAAARRGRRRDHGPGRRHRPGHAPGRCAAAVGDGPRARDHLQPARLPGGLGPCTRGARRHRRTAPAAGRVRAAGAGDGPGRGPRGARGARTGPVPALHGARPDRRHGGPLARLAEGPPRGRRDAARSTTSSM